jgi:aryl-alcohol dehydrogenase-like predicted oxidoreductase
LLSPLEREHELVRVSAEDTGFAERDGGQDAAGAWSMTQLVGAERVLGRSGIAVSAMGLGCWAIGGPFGGEREAGWGEVDDDESIRGIRRGLELGVTFFDTADVYGTGHSERILGRALGADRDRVVVATKFGNAFEDGTRRISGTDASPAHVRRACEASLRRLGTDRIDLYQLHLAELDLAAADDVAAVLEELRDEGLIRAYGWSTDGVSRARRWADRAGCATVQHTLNVLEDAPELLEVCERHGLASVNRGPLAMGLLSGKFDADARLPANDVRASNAAWLTSFENGRPNPASLERLAAIREILTSDGRLPVQGALGWIWARSERTIPIPGFKTVRQVEETVGALEHGPLAPQQMSEIDALLGRAQPSSQE